MKRLWSLFPNLVLAVISARAWIRGLQNGFESEFFAPFRHEGLLFFQNAMAAPDWRFFFIRDWSTSPFPEEHPLLYFRNLDLLHFLAGGVQWFLPSAGGALLYAIATLITWCAGLLLWKSLLNFGSVIAFVGFVTVVLLPQSFLYAPQNPYSAVLLLLSAGFISVLVYLWRERSFSQLSIRLLFTLFFLSTLTETNFTLFWMSTLSTVSVLLLLRNWPRANWKRGVQLLVIGVLLPFATIRGLHFAAIQAYGYADLFREDVEFTRELRIQGLSTNAQASEFYRQKGLTFFGTGGSPSLGQLIAQTNEVISYTYRMPLLLILGFFVALTWIAKVRRCREFEFFFLLFAVTSFTYFFMAGVTGNALINIGLQPFGFMDFQLPHRLAFFGLLSSLLVLLIPHRQVALAMALLMPLAAFKWQLSKMQKNRLDLFAVAPLMAEIPPNSEVISNYEPAMIAVKTKSRVTMNWYDKNPESCTPGTSAERVDLFRAQATARPLPRRFLLLALYPPFWEYPPDDQTALEEKFCLSKISIVRRFASDKRALLVELAPASDVAPTP